MSADAAADDANCVKRRRCLTAEGVDMAFEVVPTVPIAGQKTGTSGLRKKTREFMRYPYLHNYIQSVFNTLLDLGEPVRGGTLVIGGDGRYWNDKALQIIIKMAFANGVGRIWCGAGGLLSTPAVSAVMRSRGKGFEPFGAFICTASHNPGGPDEDFGIKFNCENGGAAPERVNERIVTWTTKIKEFRICSKMPDVGVNLPITYTIGLEHSVEVVDPVEDHLAVLRECFDFAKIKAMVTRPDFTIVYDCLHGAQGPYARRILEEELGAAAGSALHAEPMEDFGGKDTPWHGHADPNLVYAEHLVNIMGMRKDCSRIETEKPPPVFGAAADGDADRNMIMSSRFFLVPSDSVAMIVANSHLIPQFKDGLKGCARTMPTSRALDHVAKKLGIPCFETPSGWKFFGNLMDSSDPKYFPDTPKYTPFICGEEAFGTSADHLREKDGMWAVLAWLQIVAAKTEAAGKLVTVEDVAKQHWAEFGRNYYLRYDFEGVDKDKAETMMAELSGKTLAGQSAGGLEVEKNDVFNYTDPVDGSIAKNQGVRLFFTGGSRVVVRLSGTGVVGATIRMYLERYEPPGGELNLNPFEVVKPLAAAAMELARITEHTGWTQPTVIT